MAVGGFKVSLDEEDRAMLASLTGVLEGLTVELKRFNDSAQAAAQAISHYVELGTDAEALR